MSHVRLAFSKYQHDGILFLFFNAGCRRSSLFGVVAVVIRDSLATKSSQPGNQSSRDVVKGGSLSYEDILLFNAISPKPRRGSM
jgi:hypothetical protein